METVQWTKEFVRGKPVYVGIDCHKESWSVVARCEQEVLYDKALPADYGSLQKVLRRFEGGKISVVYEAGCFGYTLYDCVRADGYACTVTPPNLVPVTGSPVKTDRRDAKKLAMLHEGGLLKAVSVLEPSDRGDRELVRTYGQITEHRKCLMNQIKSKLLFYGKRAPKDIRESNWSRYYRAWIRGIVWNDAGLQRSMEELLNLFEYLDTRYRALAKEMVALSKTEKYQERVKILTSVPGIGILTAMMVLTEIQDVTRFERADQFASFLGLTPSQHSSSQNVRMGRITRCGNSRVRTALVESAWTLIRFDPAMRKKYEELKKRRGSKRAIVAIARTLAVRLRRLLLDKTEYQIGVIQ